MTPANELKGEVLHREYMEANATTLTWSQFANIVFSKGLAQTKKELFYGEK